jgi:urease accessory protein
MRHFTRRYEGDAPATEVLRLPLDQRRKSRLRTRMDSGEEVGILLPHGSILRHGDVLLGEDGSILRIEAAIERVSVVTAPDGLALARAAYHLGNRHVPVEIGDRVLRYQHDHVLDDMVRALGLEVTGGESALEPERGPYAHDPRSHTHDHDHDHDHDRR